jgi:hypothetical protein
MMTLCFFAVLRNQRVGGTKYADNRRMVSTASWRLRSLQALRDGEKGCVSRIQRAKAAIAQLVEHRIRNAGVRCSSHLSGTILLRTHRRPSVDLDDPSGTP